MFTIDLESILVLDMVCCKANVKGSSDKGFLVLDQCEYLICVSSSLVLDV